MQRLQTVVYVDVCALYLPGSPMTLILARYSHMITWWSRQCACVCRLALVCTHVHHTYPGSPIYTHTHPMTQVYP